MSALENLREAAAGVSRDASCLTVTHHGKSRTPALVNVCAGDVVAVCHTVAAQDAIVAALLAGCSAPAPERVVSVQVCDLYHLLDCCKEKG